MTKKRERPYHHGDLKEALVAAALELVDAKGPKGFSLAEVCRQAGVSVAAPYRHFADKESLLAAAAQSSFGIFRDALQSARDKHKDNPLQALTALGEAYIEFAQRNPSRFRVMFSAELHRSQFPDLYATARSAFDVVQSAIAECVDKDADGPDTYTLTVSIWSQCHGIAVLSVDGYLREIAMEQRAKELLHLALSRFISGLPRSGAEV